MIASVELPWPVRALHPNSRYHWAIKARATKKARHHASYAAMAAGITPLTVASLKATIIFHPPDNRRRDTDGMLSSCKAYIDGISDVVGVDDSTWSFILCREEPKKRGAVQILLEVA